MSRFLVILLIGLNHSRQFTRKGMWRFAETLVHNDFIPKCLCSRKAILDKCILLVIWIFDLIFSFEMKIRKSWLFWIWFCDFYQLLLSFITVGRFKVQAKSDVKLWQKSLKFDWFFLHEVLKNYIRTLSSKQCHVLAYYS